MNNKENILSIEWTSNTRWNPTTDCSKKSKGCKNCYAIKMSNRLYYMNKEKYKNNFEFTEHSEILNLPYTWKQAKVVFVNSVSDLFHESISEQFLLEVFKVMNECPQHTFQILTKRPEELLKYHYKLDFTPNIWMGVSVESKQYNFRIDLLKQSHALNKFISFEPLIGEISKVDLNGIDWVITGGESGPKSRPMKIEWVEEIQKQCTELNIPFFFKQIGGVNKKKNGNLFNGKQYLEMPESIIIL